MRLSKGQVEKKSLNISSIDRKFVNNMKITKEFLRKTKTSCVKVQTSVYEEGGIHKGHGGIA